MYIEIDEDRPNKIKLTNFEWRSQPLLNSIPSSKSVKNGGNEYWNYNLSWPILLALKHTFKDELEAGPKIKEWADNIYQTVILPSYNLRSEIQAEGYEGLFEHQKADVQFLATARRALLANDMGTGKTRSVVSTIRYLYERGETVFPILIACPNSTKFAWEDEIEKAWPGLKVNVIDGTAAKRKKLLEEKAHIYVINWEAIRTHSRLLPFGSNTLKKCVDCGGHDPKVKPGSCEAHIKELNKIQFGAVVGDEIHRIIDPSSKIARSFKSATGDTEFRFGLSGTPLSANPGDMFSILQWLYPEGYPSKGKYVERYCQVIDGYWSDVIAGIKPERKEEFFAGIDPFLRRIPKELVLQFLPPLLRTRRDVEMGTKQKKAYTQMRDQMIAEVENDDMVITTSPLTRMIRMLQFSSAYAEVEYTDVYNEETATVEHKPLVKLSDPSCKLDAFMEDIPDFGNESVVVFAVSKQLINMLAKRLEKANISYGLITGDQDAVERKEHMKRFQDGDTRFILCTISAGGTGITLTKGSKMVFLQRSWSMIENSQAEARAYRIGSEQHESVQIIDYVTRDSSEEVVFKAVEAKGEQLEAILRDKDLMKRYLKGQE